MNPSEQKKNINPYLSRQLVTRQKPRLTIDQYLRGILNGDRVVLSQAITLIESTKPSHQALAQQIIEACLPHSEQSFRIGITGTPGVGKSTFIEAFGQHLIDQRRKVAVLAIDPSSQISKGSILGDKTRMEKLSLHPKAFIRPSAAGTSLGGVAQKTRETIILCEAAGFDTILVETVGVGQSETLVHSMVDFFLLLLLPGAGDELQGIKRGIVEMADLIAINKADGDRISSAKKAKRAYQNALHLFPPKSSGWIPKVTTTSALENQGILKIWQKMEAFHNFTRQNGYFESHRQNQTKYWLYESIHNHLKEQFYTHPKVQQQLAHIEKDVLQKKTSSFKGAEALLHLFLSSQEKNK